MNLNWIIEYYAPVQNNHLAPWSPQVACTMKRGEERTTDYLEICTKVVVIVLIGTILSYASILYWLRQPDDGQTSCDTGLKATES